MERQNKIEDPFVKLEPKDAHIKMLLWGPPGSGKTYAALHAPGKVAYVNLESGADRYASLGIYAATPKSLKDIGDIIRFLRNDDTYDTVVIDSISVVWGMVMEHYIPNEKTNPNWVTIKQTWKRLLHSIINLDKNVVLIGRAKQQTGDNWWVKTGGWTLDCEGTTGHEVDFVGFSYVDINEDGEPSYQIRLEKVRELTGRVKTGMILTNTTFKQFHKRLNFLLLSEEELEESDQ
jgi:hypothetical protein